MNQILTVAQNACETRSALMDVEGTLGEARTVGLVFCHEASSNKQFLDRELAKLLRAGNVPEPQLRIHLLSSPPRPASPLGGSSQKHTSMALHQQREPSTSLSASFAFATAGRLLEQERSRDALRILEAAINGGVRDSRVRSLFEALAPGGVIPVQKRGRDRRAEHEQLRKERRTHSGQWVALIGSHVVAREPTLKGLMEKLVMLEGTETPLIEKLP